MKVKTQITDHIRRSSIESSYDRDKSKNKKNEVKRRVGKYSFKLERIERNLNLRVFRAKVMIVMKNQTMIKRVQEVIINKNTAKEERKKNLQLKMLSPSQVNPKRKTRNEKIRTKVMQEALMMSLEKKASI